MNDDSLLNDDVIQGQDDPSKPHEGVDMPRPIQGGDDTPQTGHNTPPDEGDNEPEWIGDKRYYQTGAKAGQLKPSAAQESGAVTKSPELSSPPLFDVAGNAAPSEGTSGAMLPVQRAEKKTTKGRKKSATKTEDGINPDAMATAAMVNMLLTSLCKVISDEYQQEDDIKVATLAAMHDYFDTENINLPPWVGLLTVVSINVSLAIKTPKGQTKVAKLWDKIRAYFLNFRSGGA